MSLSQFVSDNPRKNRYYHASPCGKAAFTIIEMLIVVLVIAILAGTTVPKMLSAISRAKDVSAKKDIQTLGAAVISYKGAYGEFPTGMWLTSDFEANGNRPLVPDFLVKVPYDQGLRKSPTYLGMLKDVILFSGATPLISSGAYGYVGASYNNYQGGRVSSAVLLAEVENMQSANWLLADKNPGAATYVPGAIAHYGPGSPANMVGRYSYILTTISGASTSTTDYFDNFTPIGRYTCSKVRETNVNLGYFIAVSGSMDNVECLVNRGIVPSLLGYTNDMLGYRYMYVY